MKWLKNFDRLLEIQRNIVWPSVLEMDPKQYYPEFLKTALSKQPCERLIVSPRRQILIEGPLLMFEAGKPTEMFIILFDDLLLLTRKKKALSKKVQCQLSRGRLSARATADFNCFCPIEIQPRGKLARARRPDAQHHVE